ncbi:apolipo L3-like [Pelobates cultripes]|uniref:Apolipo L3-like n=1 Tax=Pelobates cultripes TaxID=61616 RepID=A0AAD1RAK7_PELCU|nr:apolipo L3-like [Pelobates cultripes]
MSIQNNFNISGKALEEYLKLEKKVRIYLKEYEDTQTCYLNLLEKCIKELRSIADDVDKFHRGAIITNIAGSSVGIAGGITTIVGLALAPFTFGASLIVAGVGIGVATAGGLTGAAASIADHVNIKNKCKKVEEIIEELKQGMDKMQELVSEINTLIDNIRSKLGLINCNFARVGVRGVFAATEITRLAQLVKLSTTAARGAQLAARGAQAATAVSGVFAALFLVLDIAFVIKGAQDLKNGAKSDQAAKIRKVADDLEAEFNTMHDTGREWELQLSSFSSTTSFCSLTSSANTE